MYIIGKNKDYYDGVVGSMGIDKTIVYERKTIELDNGEKVPASIFHHVFPEHTKNTAIIKLAGLNDLNKDGKKKYEGVDGFIVGFCGKLYFGWKFGYKKKVWNDNYERFDNEYFYDVIYGYDNAKKYLDTRYWGRNYDDTHRDAMNFNPIEIFREFNVPVFIYDHHIWRKCGTQNTGVILNPILKEYEFYKVFDSFMAFQEISMFIGGVLGVGEKEIVEISNENKIVQHGFDKKWSFRKEPTKKK